MKRCPQCWKEKPLNAFAGLATCIECRAKYRGWAKKSAEERAAYGRAGVSDASAYRANLTVGSKNAKLGGIPTSTTARGSCPRSCAFFEAGCYAEFHVTAHHWRRLGAGELGAPWIDFCREVARLPARQLWRHNTAGDLPGRDEMIDFSALALLVDANQGRRGFTFTHKPVIGRRAQARRNAMAVRFANVRGFTVNLSANNLAHADQLAALDLAPVVVVLPPDAPASATRTPEGRTRGRLPGADIEPYVRDVPPLRQPYAQGDRRLPRARPGQGARRRAGAASKGGSVTATPTPIDVFGEEPEFENAPAKTAEELEDEAWCDRVWRTCERESRDMREGLATEFPPLQLRQPPAPEPHVETAQGDEPASDEVLAEPEPAAPVEPERTTVDLPAPERTPMHLTERQQQCLSAIRELHAEGVRPSMRMIAERAGIPGPTPSARASTTLYALKSLKGTMLDWGVGGAAHVVFLDGAVHAKRVPRPSPRVAKQEATNLTGRHFPPGTKDVPPERIIGVALEDSTPMPDGTHRVTVALGARTLADVAAAHVDPEVAFLRQRRQALLAQVKRIDAALLALEAVG